MEGLTETGAPNPFICVRPRKREEWGRGGIGLQNAVALSPLKTELHSQVSMRVILCGLCTRVDTHSHTGECIFASAGQHVSKFAPASAHSTKYTRDFLLPMHTIRDRYTQTRTCVCTYLCESEQIHTRSVYLLRFTASMSPACKCINSSSRRFSLG